MFEAFDWADVQLWDGPGAIEGVVEELAGDRLARSRYAEFLTKYLVAEGKQRNYVLNLNAEWGAGKTWFIKRWYMELKQHYPTVYIDAWQQDFSEDPLLTVISSIIDQLKEVAGKENKIPEGMRQRLLGLFKVGGKLALKAAIKKAGLEEDDFSLEGEDANQLVDALCSNQKERYESIQHLKQEIRKWVEGSVGLSDGGLDYPAFILIDELDRCRPSYAVEMLETIKHIFDIKGVVFVLATDTEQLQHAIKVIYGSGFDAQNYLGRFFQRRFTLSSLSKREFIINRFEPHLPITSSVEMWPDIIAPEIVFNVMTAVCDYFSLNLRQVEQLVDRFIAIMNSDGDGAIGRINLLFLVYLFALHEKDYAHYRLVSEGRVDRHGIGERNEASFDGHLKRRQDKVVNICLSPSLVLGNPIDGTWKDGRYSVSLISLLNYSYEMMLSHSHYKLYRLNNDNEFRTAISSHVSAHPLSHFQAALLARPELSQLEHRFDIYKNFIEMAVHLE